MFAPLVVSASIAVPSTVLLILQRIETCELLHACQAACAWLCVPFPSCVFVSDWLLTAGLFTGDRGQIAVGVVLVVLLPIGFLLVSACFIWRRLYHASIPSRRAAFILEEDPEIVHVRQCCSMVLACVYLFAWA